MSLRMVPVRATFQKMARLVRDLSHSSQKQINLVTSGEETELDKTMVDLIADPLVHMMRNAVDHGIEPPRERTSAGKPAAATIELRAFHRGSSIYIMVSDDGRGLDKNAILSRAREKGLVGASETLSDSEIYTLIFRPGFSTARAVTDVSGRGVGLDVVKRNIESLNGRVEAQSQPGTGTAFTIRLPLTLAIIDGLVVRVDSERYIIPTHNVVRAVMPRNGDVQTVVNKGEMLTSQETLLPLFRLERLLENDGSCAESPRRVAVIAEDEGKAVALMADELVGKQQFVIKNLGETMKGMPGVSGSTIMSDGTVGLILNIGGLVRMAGAAADSALANKEATTAKERI
jgi:two-component system chemotaxis sensor kinase CheA